MAMNAACSVPSSTERLHADLEAMTAEAPGRFAVVFEDLSDPANRVAIREREVFHAASTMKTPVMAELWRQAAAGERSLDDSVLVKNEFASIVDGSPYSMDISRDGGEALYDAIGQRRTLRQLARDMIAVSSNLATNILIELAGPQKVTAYLRSLGADSIEVLRGVEDIKAFEAGLSNRTSARDLALLFRHLHEMGPAAEEMIGILQAQQFKEMIGGGLPESVAVASKSGSITGVAHDSGLVFLPDGRVYVLVILSDGLPDQSSGVEVGAKLSRRIYEHMMSR